MTRVNRVGSGYILLIFGVTWVLGALLYILLHEPSGSILSIAEAHSTTNESATGINYIRKAWNGVPYAIALLGMIQLLVGAALVRGGLR